jgi:hypothetical protein
VTIHPSSANHLPVILFAKNVTTTPPNPKVHMHISAVRKNHPIDRETQTEKPQPLDMAFRHKRNITKA